MQERLEKKAILIAGSMRKFLASYWTARQAMLEEEAIKKLVRHGGLHALGSTHVCSVPSNRL